MPFDASRCWQRSPRGLWQHRRSGLEDADGQLPTNLDTTGGNSGSPVLNAKGELIGLNFDSNWESVSAKLYPTRATSVPCTDMRYLRWLLAKVYPSSCAAAGNGRACRVNVAGMGAAKVAPIHHKTMCTQFLR